MTTATPTIAYGRTRPTDISSGIAAMKRAVVYVRVSTDQQVERDRDGGDGFSIPAQKDACHRKAEAMGAMVVDEYIDRGESARSSDRPALQAMLKRLTDQRDIDYVIVHKIDRLARNRADDVNINLAITQAGAQLVSVTENIDDTPSGMLLHGIMSSIAEFYSRNLATEIRKGMNQKAKSGSHPGRAPLGYLNVRDFDGGKDIRTIGLDPERADHIRWAFEAFATGEYTLEQLGDALAARGLTTRATKKAPSQPLMRQSVHKMLRNRFYIGMVTWGGAEYVGTHEPLVTVETFAMVQAILHGRTRDSLKQRYHNHFLKGILVCGRCGSRMTFSKTTGNGGIYEYWMCAGRHGKRTACDLPSIQSDVIEARVPNLFEPITLSAERIGRLRDTLVDAMKLQLDGVEAETRKQRKRIKRLETERRRLLQAHLAGAVPLELLQEEQTRIANELANAAGALASSQIDWETIETNLDQTIKLAANLRSAYERGRTEARRQLVQTLFSAIEVDTDGLTSRLADPFAGLLADDLVESIEHAVQVADMGDHGPVNPADGLKESPLVGAEGLEPPTSAL